uniref:Plant heme peroxidase family profile domain-containing protein n=1 Tax=Aegilops tauschii subsp. strangulata TaxID=200361 RepID=A0A452YV09_AEGTS
GKCGNASVEAVIQSAVQARLVWDKRMVAGLLHMLFHDCFVQGCDASLLLDGPNTEKTAPQNSGIFGYDFIDDIKSDLEAACPGVVSCADIIIAATRDAIALTVRRAQLCGDPGQEGRHVVGVVDGRRPAVAARRHPHGDRHVRQEGVQQL